MTARRTGTLACVGWLLAVLPAGSAAAASDADRQLRPAGPAPAAVEVGPRRVTPAELTPLPAAPVVSPQARALRAQLLGPFAGRPGYVTLSWFGVSGAVVTVGEHLLLFDAWQIPGAYPDFLPVGREQLAALEPEAILVGHGDFDHAGDLGYVAGSAGATVVGSAEHCDVAAAGAVREGVGTDFTCVVLGDETTPPGSMVATKLFADVEPIMSVVHVHSAARPPGEDNPLDPYVEGGDQTPFLTRYLDDPEELARLAAQMQENERGPSLLHQVRAGAFSLALADSAGPLSTVPAAAEALASLPGCVDVLWQAVQGFGQVVSGLEDVKDYVDAARPSVFYPQHADRWVPGLGTGQQAYVDKWAQTAAQLAFPPETVWLYDPEDYLATQAFAVGDPRWAAPPAGSRCAVAAEAGDPVSPPADPPAQRSDAAAGDRARTLPATGGGGALPGLLLLSLAALGVRRARRPLPTTRRRADPAP